MQVPRLFPYRPKGLPDTGRGHARASGLRRCGVLALTCLALAALPACARKPGQDLLKTGHELNLVPTRADRFVPWTNVEASYRLGAGDKIKVKYLVTPEMDEDLTVAPDGTIGLRTAGQIKAEGMTLSGLEATVKRLATKEVAEQRIVVSLDEAVSPRVYVGGSVRNPGPYRLVGMRLSALQAVLLAGGFVDEARLGEIALIRRDPTNRPMLRTVNVRDIIQSGTAEGDIPLMSGDIVYVPRSTIAEVDLWVDQFINKVLPFQRSFSYTLGAYSVSQDASNVLPN